MFISLFLAVWVCLNMGSENMVLVKLLQLGAKNFTVYITYPTPPLRNDSKTRKTFLTILLDKE